MIEKITIENFQKHRKSVFEFDPVTTFVGPSDTGKSAIMRALRWVMLNEPDGDSFVSYGAKGCTVRLYVDGHVIVRRRGGSKNEYELDGEVYKAFGRGGVPEQIAEILRVTPINFQSQHDLLYWLQLNGADLAKALNRVVDLEIIDASLVEVNKRLRRSKSELEIRDRDLIEVDQQIDALDWFEIADVEFRKCVRIAEKWQDVQKQQNALSVSHQSVIDLKSREKVISDAVSDATFVEIGDRIEITSKQANVLQAILRGVRASDRIVDRSAVGPLDLDVLLGDWKQAAEQRRLLKSAIDFVHQQQSSVTVVDPLDFDEEIAGMESIAQDAADLHEIIQAVEMLRNKISHIDEELKRWSVYLDQFDVCPLCGK